MLLGADTRPSWELAVMDEITFPNFSSALNDNGAQRYTVFNMKRMSALSLVCRKLFLEVALKMRSFLGRNDKKYLRDEK